MQLTFVLPSTFPLLNANGIRTGFFDGVAFQAVDFIFYGDGLIKVLRFHCTAEQQL